MFDVSLKKLRKNFNKNLGKKVTINKLALALTMCLVQVLKHVLDSQQKTDGGGGGAGSKPTFGVHYLAKSLPG